MEILYNKRGLFIYVEHKKGHSGKLKYCFKKLKKGSDDHLEFKCEYNPYRNYMGDETYGTITVNIEDRVIITLKKREWCHFISALGYKEFNYFYKDLKRVNGLSGLYGWSGVAEDISGILSMMSESCPEFFLLSELNV